MSRITMAVVLNLVLAAASASSGVRYLRPRSWGVVVVRLRPTPSRVPVRSPFSRLPPSAVISITMCGT